MSQDKYIFRKAVAGDIPAVEKILKDAVSRMLAEGKQQWDENYPNVVHVVADMARDVAFVLETRGEVVAYGAVVFDGEPAYDRLAGEWLSDQEYVVVHRIAVSQHAQGNGVGARFMKAVEFYAAEKGIGSFRVDTNFDNFAMLRLIGKCGFEYCGEVVYERGSRKAFEKLI